MIAHGFFISFDCETLGLLSSRYKLQNDILYEQFRWVNWKQFVFKIFGIFLFKDSRKFFICTNYYVLLKLNSWILLFTYILVDMLHQFRVFWLNLVEIENSILWV